MQRKKKARLISASAFTQGRWSCLRLDRVEIETSTRNVRNDTKEPRPSFSRISFTNSRIPSKTSSCMDNLGDSCVNLYCSCVYSPIHLSAACLLYTSTAKWELAAGLERSVGKIATFVYYFRAVNIISS